MAHALYSRRRGGGSRSKVAIASRNALGVPRWFESDPLCLWARAPDSSPPSFFMPVWEQAFVPPLLCGRVRVRVRSLWDATLRDHACSESPAVVDGRAWKSSPFFRDQDNLRIRLAACITFVVSAIDEKEQATPDERPMPRFPPSLLVSARTSARGEVARHDKGRELDDLMGAVPLWAGNSLREHLAANVQPDDCFVPRNTREGEGLVG